MTEHATSRPYVRGTLAERFWPKVAIGASDECWPWLASLQSDGYGQIAIAASRPVLAHRVAYELTYGPVPEGLGLDHTCHDPRTCWLRDKCPHRSCCNPAHLEAVTQSVNVKRGMQGLSRPFGESLVRA